jgi:hypothetical protein
MQHTVNCKMIYANILRECGYGCSVISRSITNEPRNYLHYFKTFPFYIKTDVSPS